MQAPAISDDVMEMDESQDHAGEPDDEVAAAASATEEKEKSPAKTSSTTIRTPEVRLYNSKLGSLASIV